MRVSGGVVSIIWMEFSSVVSSTGGAGCGSTGRRVGGASCC